MAQFVTTIMSGRLEDARRREIHEAIASYAAAAAGTADDLDPLLEDAAVEFLQGDSERESPPCAEPL